MPSGRLPFRIGQGVDIHPFGGAGPLWLGTIEIPAAPGLDGHSDGDVLSHAIADAILGAIGAGDIGTLFPATSQTPRGFPSRGILDECVRRAKALGYRVAQVDATVVAARPRLEPHRDAIRHAIAAVLAVAEGRVSVKLKSANGVGAVGQGDAIAAFAAVLMSVVE